MHCFCPLTGLSISLPDDPTVTVWRVSFPSPYGVIYLITEDFFGAKDVTVVFPSPYGVIYLITCYGFKSDKCGYPFPSPYGVIYLITEDFFGAKDVTVVFPSPYGVIYLITHIPERPVFMRPSKVLCFSLIRLSPILNHAAHAHLHQLIIISSALYHM